MAVARDIAAGITKAWAIVVLSVRRFGVVVSGHWCEDLHTMRRFSGSSTARLGLELCRLDLQEVLIRSTATYRKSGRIFRTPEAPI